MNATDFVNSYFDAWNQKDSQAIANHLAENGVYADIPIHQNMSRDELIAHLDELFEHEANVYELTGEVLAGEDTIAFQYKVYPKNTDKSKPAPAIWHGAEFVTLRDGVAIEIADYYEQDGQQAPPSPVASATGAPRVQRYAKSGLDDAQIESVKKQLSALMDQDQLYLQSDITLPELAGALNCTVNHLSQVINAGFGVSFFDFLNQYRVRDAMQLLREKNEDPRTVLSVALDVGFNSTSTFYVAFKKVSGMTPAQYRKQVD